MKEQIKAALLGVAIGDALGVPAEFTDRNDRKQKPVDGMWSYGTHGQPAGTFSDDASLTFCLAEVLAEGFDLNTIGQNFVRWFREGFWSAHGRVFDIGIATRHAIIRLEKGEQPEYAGGMDVSSNGNGSLMRILPLVFYIKDMPIEDRYRITKLVSSITHGHVRSVIACFYYLEFARQLLRTNDNLQIYLSLQTQISELLNSMDIVEGECAIFDRLLIEDISKLNEEDINSSGYVVHTLEASIWCLLTTNNYKDALIKAVNLGDDTDTTGAVTGGLAALLYGHQNIPNEWLEVLARRNDIEELATRMNKALSFLI